MTQFPLCEEMGLEVRNPALAYKDELEFNSKFYIKASDVEKMLQSAIKINPDAHIGKYGRESLVLAIPQKPKPVTKEDVLQALKTLNVLHNKFDHVSELIERIEKAGIE